MRHLLIVFLLAFASAGCAQERHAVYVETYPSPGPVLYVYGYDPRPYEGGYYFVGGYYGGTYYHPGYYRGHAPFWHEHHLPPPYVHVHVHSGPGPHPPAHGPAMHHPRRHR